jgi:misacylated tRNA(Ala) deacylase
MRPAYLDDSYLREFRAKVISANVNSVVLDKTLFYPQSGGQPFDQGSLLRGEEEFKVTRAEVADGKIIHVLDRGGFLIGDEVRGVLDWERRYNLMRGHTACHILSAVIFKETGAKITGNQIDLGRSRVDFSLEKFDKSQMTGYIEAANKVVGEDRAVASRFLSKKEAMKIPDLIRLAMEVPDREEIRVVEIAGVDAQACGGTHIRRTGEVGIIKFIKAENKGKANRRVYFEID